MIKKNTEHNNLGLVVQNNDVISQQDIKILKMFQSSR